MQTRFDAIIVGAGPAGCAAAILLSRAGWHVALVERQRYPRRKVCGECIAASNLALLDGLGLGGAIAAHAGPELKTVVLMRGDDQLHAQLPAGGGAGHPWGRALGRESLDALLLESARGAGARVLQPWSAQSFDGGPGRWRCILRACGNASGSAPGTHQVLTLTAPVAIAANGSWERLAAGRQGRARRHGASDLLAFKANFLGSSLPPGLLPVLALDGGYGGMVIADHGVATIACCLRRDRLEALRRGAPGASAGEAVEAWMRQRCAGVRRALLGATRDGQWLAAGPIDPGIRVRAGDQIFRIGNAAGEAHPILGEGISMALQSAGLLCALLVDAGPRRCASDARWQRKAARVYARDWRRSFAPRLRIAALFAHLAMRPCASALLATVVRCWPGLLTRGARWGGKVDCAADPAAFAGPAIGNPINSP